MKKKLELLSNHRLLLGDHEEMVTIMGFQPMNQVIVKRASGQLWLVHISQIL